MSEETSAAGPKKFRMNALTGIGILLVVVGLLPAFAGSGGVAALPLLIGVLLIVGGAVVHTIRSR